MKVILLTVLLLLLNLQANTLQPLRPYPILTEEPIVSNTVTRQKYIKTMKQNNPFNIRVNAANNWLGKVPTKNGFETFDTLEHGIRAGLKLLQNYYYTKRGLNTVTDIINVYAPPIENDTKNYIAVVCKYTGFEPNQVLDLTDKDTLIRLVEAMIFMEQGIWINPVNSTYNKYFKN